jgi:hypothetical protein
MSTRSTRPISFSLLDDDEQPVMDIVDDVAGGRDLNLQITNSSGRDLKLTNLSANEAGAGQHHFELRFRPGVLNPKAQIAVAGGDGQWLISKPIPTKGTVSLYLLNKNAATLPAGSALTLRLRHISAHGGRGGRGTRVELKYKNVEPLAAGYCEQHLSIVNQRGHKHIPLHVGIVGANKILNDGSTPNTLTLRITNLSGESSIQLNPKNGPDGPSEFIFSFDCSDNEEWALATLSQAQGIEIEAHAETNGVRKQFYKFKPQGKSTSFSIWPLTQLLLGPGKFIEVTLSKVITSLPSGQTNLYVHYKRIPGYWDGQFVCVIEKGPLVYRGDNVGIQTTLPGATLQVGNHPSNAGGQDFGKGVAAMFTCSKANFAAEPETVLVLAREGKEGNSYANFVRFDLGMFEGNGSKSQLDIRLSHDHLQSESEGKKTPVIMSLRSNGNVGIGTDSPEAKLHVKGNSRFEGSFRCGGLFVSRLVDKDNSEDNVKILSGSEVSNVWPDPPDRKFKPTILVGDEIRIHDQIRTVTHIEESFLTLGAPFPKEYTKATMTVLGVGNVGIGTTSPRSKLAVADGVAIGFAYANEETAPANGLLVEGRIGIGTPSPRAVLEIAGSQPPAVGANALPVLQVTGGKGGNNTSGKAGAGASVTIRAGDGGDALPGQTGGRGGSISLQSGHVGVGTDFQMEDSGFANIILQPAGGSVVIGNTGTNPSRGKLEVVGHLYAQGINGIPMDLAENYLSDNDLAPGDVVCLDRNDDKIILSHKPDDLMVAGVISTEPGFLLNAKHDDDLRKDNLVAYPVALRGRVPCKVVDEIGSIKRGDLLTTSSTTGHAMKASPLNVGGIEIYRPGTIIGKALASHESGRGVIEVLITGS